MKFLVFALTFGCLNLARAQQLSRNICDSSILSADALRRCKMDSVFEQDIIIRINYQILLRTQILNSYRANNTVTITDDLKGRIKALRKIYDSTLNHKRAVFLYDSERHSNYTQPKSYINSVLVLQEFAVYPDTYAILGNDMHLILNPKTDTNFFQPINEQIQTLYNALPYLLKTQLEQIVGNLEKERNVLSEALNHIRIFRGTVSDEERIKYNIIDYLLWIENLK